jgi:hypothetical protein
MNEHRGGGWKGFAHVRIGLRAIRKDDRIASNEETLGSLFIIIEKVNENYSFFGPTTHYFLPFLLNFDPLDLLFLFSRNRKEFTKWDKKVGRA